MGITVIKSSASHQRIAHGRDWLKARTLAEEVLIIGATLGAANEIARSLSRTKGASFGHHRMTLGQLASTLARPALSAQKLVPLGALGVQAVANRAIHKLAEAGALGRYAKLTDGPGFARAIANVITELRLEQIKPDALAGVAPDLRDLLEAYERELADHAFADWPGVLRLAAAAGAQRDNRHRLLGLPTLLLDMPVRTASDVAIVRALSSRSSEMLVTVPANDTTTFVRLRTGFEIETVDLDSRSASQVALDLQEDGSLARVQRHLFNDAGPFLGAQLDQVAIFSPPGESRECVEIVRRVLALAREGVALDRIALLLRSPQEYRSHLEEAFGRASVPVYFARGAVRPDPAGRAFYALLCCAAENLSARRFAEYLSLSQVPDAKPDGSPPEAAPSNERWVAPDQDLIPRAVAEALSAETLPQNHSAPSNDPAKEPVISGQLRAPRRWERLLVETAVIGGRERWRKRIDGFAQELRSRVAEVDDENEASGMAIRRTLADLEAFAGYSPTALQHYAECPYKFFLQAIHKLAPREVPEAIDELDPLQRGALIHEIQFELFERLSEANLLPITRQNLEPVRKMLDDVIEQVARQFYSDLAPAIDRVWNDGIDSIRVDLREWLRRASEDDSGYVPWRFELSFGLSDGQKPQPADSHSSPKPVDLDCGIQLRGSIDLVERHPSGHIRISDHKTGKADAEDRQIIAGGKSLQPALYALVAEKLFRGELKVDCGRLYFCTSTGGFTEVVVPLDQHTRNSIAQVAAIIGEALDKPFLPAAPAERQCAWCDYQPVCGPYEELRTRRKPKEPLASLLKLRDMP